MPSSKPPRLSLPRRTANRVLPRLSRRPLRRAPFLLSATDEHSVAVYPSSRGLARMVKLSPVNHDLNGAFCDEHERRATPCCPGYGILSRGSAVAAGPPHGPGARRCSRSCRGSCQASSCSLPGNQCHACSEGSAASGSRLSQEVCRWPYGRYARPFRFFADSFRRGRSAAAHGRTGHYV